MQLRCSPILLPVILTSIFGCACGLVHRNSFESSNAKIPAQTVFAIKDVNVIPMLKGDTVLQHATVVISAGKIVSVSGPVPDSAEVIDGRGKWLIPGLIDMHVHGLADLDFGVPYPTKGARFFIDNQDMMTLYVANGVTTIVDLNARAENFGQRNEIVKGNIIGPRMALAALINGGTGAGRIANTPSDGRQTVRMVKADGYEFVKVYSQLSRETFKAIIEEAKSSGLKVIGHIPNAFKGRIEDAFIPHFGMVAHAEEFGKQTNDFSDGDADRFAMLAKQNGTWLSPTLVVMESIMKQSQSLDAIRNLKYLRYVHPLLQSKWLTANQYNQGANPQRVAQLEKLVSFNKKVVKSFHKAGVPIVTGTDAGTSGVVWGFAMHQELELLVSAGLTPQEALLAATRLPATWLGIEDKVGTVDVGRFADLILLEANPLENIQNIQKISGVFVNGRWVSKKTIDNNLADLAKRNAENKDKYDWQRRTDY